ncbi:FKBP-type peptidyl-prolyl cis-trans isomerase [Streptacidiphilus sp. ASG 303]|uniref:FKBP-type peptidyl-prolyl cis-trans isomerase n=1 Tax=Streptacidiphilus sp. ASG 303 TaxID=2896847 RepID=UPI001E4408CB|nr:FKBP-type peptidyl-prolyl cis-trans isomerase [Streptacidiphilus sp. ASG 303]MCD0481324.1 FKBP-type peptidyl-prolyl cis-trans isomerase [Streptacidiphilus sp. ASG 303]
MSENAPGPGDPRGTSDPAALRPGGAVGGTGESIVVRKAEVGRRVARPAEEEQPQVFASNVRRRPQSEAGYDEEPTGVGRLGVVLGTVLAVLLVGSGVTLYLANRGGDDAAAPAAEAAQTPTAAPSAPPQPTVPPIKDTAAVLPTVTGAFGKPAVIQVPKAKPDGTFVVKTLSQGGGPVVKKGDWVTVDYTGKDWESGKAIPGSYDKGGHPQFFQAGAGELIAALDRSIAGHRVGSRVLVVAPPAAAFGAQGNPQAGVGPGHTLTFALDIVRATDPAAVVQGAPVPAPAGLPQVQDHGRKAATITPPKGVPAPKELKSAVLIPGKGPKVTAGQKVVVQYTGLLYSNGKKFDSSLDRGQAFSFATGGGQVIEGWDKGLVGQKVGSRVELVIPPSLGYKDQAQGSIPANSTLVFVVDILDAG